MELRWLFGFLLGLAVGLAGARRLPEALRALGMERRNFQGRPIATGGGLLFLAVALLLLAASLPTPPLLDPSLAPAVAALLFGALGWLDDRFGTHEHKGLRGHLRALAQGRVTTGLVKAAGGLGAAVLLALWIAPVPERGPAAAVVAPLVALAANGMNLLDLRPLRALKLFWLAAALLLPASDGPAVAALLGASLPYARLEARRRAMLGDTGSNALGAALGCAAALCLPLWAAAALVVALAAFHLWAERHSLSGWIDARPWAAALDRWGWEADPS